jgi:hypothetical protein
MALQHGSFPFRWVLPIVQLGICVALLWPMRGFLVFEIMESLHSYSILTPKTSPTSDSNVVYNIVVPTTPEEQRQADGVTRLWEARKTAPLALNFPVLIVQLPYVILSPSKSEWVPRGMFVDVWRALSWPFVGMFFWWFLGRGVEALSAARRSVGLPRISLIETIFALILFCIGLVMLVGILMSTPDDRRDIQFLVIIAGGLLWGVLATLTIAARFQQWRIGKRSAQAQSTI